MSGLCCAVLCACFSRAAAAVARSAATTLSTPMPWALAVGYPHVYVRSWYVVLGSFVAGITPSALRAVCHVWLRCMPL